MYFETLIDNYMDSQSKKNACMWEMNTRQVINYLLFYWYVSVNIDIAGINFIFVSVRSTSSSNSEKKYLYSLVRIISSV